MCIRDRVGWGLLPDMVTIRPPTAANHHYVPKGQGLLLNLAMTEIFAALFWRWPREWVYLAGSLIGLLFTFALLYNCLLYTSGGAHGAVRPAEACGHSACRSG